MLIDNPDIGIVVAIVAIAILVLSVVAVMLISGRSREELRALDMISEQLKEIKAADGNRMMFQMPQAVTGADCTAIEGIPAVEKPRSDESADRRDEPRIEEEESAVSIDEGAEPMIDPLEEIFRAGLYAEKTPEPKVDKSNLGRSGKRYSKEELEVLIKN